ncbi:alpha/beta fold hydrolase [Mesorhizobium sp.]|uniref:alpha/beta fold hydrolase n=1 Tax=Mesorhizobium sp. TaxID=1871066 RepID=UPI0025E61035|nr:alpha/beta fold hydrolase [Mesorhizobium sp.]
MTKTYVLVHGAWHGGWCWRDVAANLRKMGCHVTTPTQTGVGERAHLLCKDITPDTFVTDIVNHIVTEELSDVILVGHSLGGISITGAADRIPDHISHLVYLARRRHRRERSKCIQHCPPTSSPPVENWLRRKDGVSSCRLRRQQHSAFPRDTRSRTGCGAG